MRDTRVFVHVLWRLLCDARLPLDYAGWADRFADELASTAEALGDRLPLGRVIVAARMLADKSRRLQRIDPARANAALMRLSRLLVPLHAHSGDRFTHDPALPQPSWPGLQTFRDLVATEPGSDHAYLHDVAARRARNRLAHALSSACALLDAA